MERKKQAIEKAEMKTAILGEMDEPFETSGSGLSILKSKELILPLYTPFHSCDEDCDKALVESVKAYGALDPILLRKCDNDILGVLSGWYRNMANMEVGNRTIKAIILTDITDAKANYILTTTNIQRNDFEKYKPSKSI